METNTDIVKRPIWKEVNDEIRTRAARTLELIDSLENVSVDEWDKRRLVEIRDWVGDDARLFSTPNIRLKMLHGTVRIYTDSNTNRWDATRAADGSLTNEWRVTTRVEVELSTVAHAEFAPQLVKLSAIFGGLAAVFEQKIILVVEETAEEATLRAEIAAAKKARDAKNEILLAAINLACKGMRVTSAPRSIPLAILTDVPEGKHNVDVGTKSYVVNITPKRATIDRTR